MINVTKTFLPPFEEYTALLKQSWDRNWITNNGLLAQELEVNLSKYLGVKHLLFAGNGTIVLQMALKALGITKEVITTPFSYVATTNVLLWEGAIPVFVDIKPNDFCIDPKKIEAAITEKTQAILATHVYGLPCDVDAIEQIASKYNLKVIYDGAHAFGVQYKGRSLLSYGDISTCSFHATKIFHTVEGGCIICHDEEMERKLFLMRSFGHLGDDYYSVGINGKNSEFHAAMGLSIFPYLEKIIAKRKEIHNQYMELLKDCGLRLIEFDAENLKYNYAYFPILFPTEKKLMNVRDLLVQSNINTRRYFYPSLNSLPFIHNKTECRVSEDIARRVLCLPMYHDLTEENVEHISSVIVKTAF
jgi:dTDP-4-amino-4,6-dideoxygalactose transaminase